MGSVDGGENDEAYRCSGGRRTRKKKHDIPTYVSISLEKVLKRAAELTHLPLRSLTSGVVGR